MAMITANASGDADGRMSEVFGPAQIDHMIPQAVQFCWMTLPNERRTLEELEQQTRRILERALKDFREDRQAFGKEITG